MTKAPSPLLGYNNNVRHKNRVFHIQTEDSGIKHPHIITHIFMDGGRILKSVKTSYAEHVDDDKVGDIVRKMMKEQHKAMFRALRDGDLDTIVDDAIAAGGRKSDAAMAAAKRAQPVTLPEEAAPKTQRDEAQPQPLTLDLDVLEVEQVHAFQPQGDLPPPPPNVLTARGGDPGTGRYRTLEDREERAPHSRARSEHPPPRTERTPARTETADRDTKAKKSERPPASTRPPRSERPPRTTPKSDRPRSDRAAATVREERVKRSDPRAEPPSEPKQPVATGSSRPSRGEPAKPARGPAPAAVRPAAIFGQARPQQSSIFGEDIISDKSLDEVILSYLAEDLEEGSK